MQLFYSFPRAFRCLSMLLLLACYCACAHAQQSDTVTNQTVIQLAKAGISKEVIIAKINASPCTFDVSAAGLIALKNGSVPDDIISLMVGKGSSAPVQNTAPDAGAPGGGEASLQPGLYYFDANTNNYVEIDPAVLSNNKQGGLGEATLRNISPLFNAKLKESLSGSEANLKINNAKPLFVFVIDIANGKDGPAVRSPNEVFLVKLKQGKNDRELVVGKSNSVGSDQGIEDKAKLPFTYNKIQQGLYEVSPNNPLPTGEYCFSYATAAGSDQGVSYAVYDFSIRIPGDTGHADRHHH